MMLFMEGFSCQRRLNVALGGPFPPWPDPFFPRCSPRARSGSPAPSRGPVSSAAAGAGHQALLLPRRLDQVAAAPAVGAGILGGEGVGEGALMPGLRRCRLPSAAAAPRRAGPRARPAPARAPSPASHGRQARAPARRPACRWRAAPARNGPGSPPARFPHAPNGGQGAPAAPSGPSGDGPPPRRGPGRHPPRAVAARCADTACPRGWGATPGSHPGKDAIGFGHAAPARLVAVGCGRSSRQPGSGAAPQEVWPGLPCWQGSGKPEPPPERGCDAKVDSRRSHLAPWTGPAASAIFVHAHRIPQLRGILALLPA